MAKRGKKSTRLTVSLDPEDHAALAAKSDASLSWVVRQAIHRFIQQHQAYPELTLALPDEPPSPFRTNYR